jgi:molecular chaperone DnaK
MNTTGFGIDFGTTNSFVAFHNPAGRVTTACRDVETALPHPSALWYRPGEQTRVGLEAKKHVSRFSGVAGHAFVQSVKQHLGQNKTFDICGVNTPAVDVAADLFRFLLEDAHRHYRVQPTEGVVTIPLYFDGHARRELRRAAAAAGFYVKAFLHEPFAALIGYVCKNKSTHDLKQMAGQTVLVFDWGGGTLDITVGRIEEEQIVELATAGLPARAGNYFDQLLAAYARRRFFEAKGIPADGALISPGTKDRYLAETERCKIALSRDHAHTMQLAGFCEHNGSLFDLQQPVTRPAFEQEIRDTVDEAIARVDGALESAGLTARQIDLCLLVGGTSLIPLVQEQLRERFGHSIVTVKDADSIIAEGAAFADAYDMRAAFADTVALELSDGTFYSIFRKGDLAIPSTCSKTLNLFCTDNRDGQARLILGLHDSLRSKFDRKAVVVAPVSPDLPTPYNHERIALSLQVDEDLVLKVNAKGATQPADRAVTEEIVDLRYSVSLAGV